jgi:hypothetical protein
MVQFIKIFTTQIKKLIFIEEIFEYMVQKKHKQKMLEQIKIE